MKIKFYHILLLVLAFSLGSCESFLENKLPSDEIEFEQGLQTESDLQQLLNSTYDVYANFSGGDKQKFPVLMGEDGFIDGNSGFLVQVYLRATDFFNSDVGGFYNNPYFAITRANTLLENLDRVEMSEGSRARMEGEAKTLRAICHFELVRLFGHPYGYSNDNSHLGIVVRTTSAPVPQTRNTVKEVYDQIVADLTEAENLLPAENGIYLNRFAAKAFLARVYLTMQDYEQALTYAQDVINNSGLQISTNINNRYMQDEIPQEALFYTVSRGLEDNRSQRFRDLFSSDSQIPTVKASSDYAALIQADTSDRRNQWLESANGFWVFTKFNLTYFNVTQISLTEMYLIAAECMGLLGQQQATAVSYINAIKRRAGVTELGSGANASVILQEARLEKRKEFGGEGINFFDLKRRGAAGENILIRDAPWDCPGMILQFPASEITIKGFVMNDEAGCS